MAPPVVVRVFVVALLASAPGCQREQPPPFETLPVAGKVVFKGGSIQRLERGKVWFQSVTDPKLTAVGTIDEEGAFQMTTLFEEKGYAGVPPGQYKVRLEPPLDDERQPQTDLIHPKFLDYDKSGLKFTVPASGEITVTVHRPPR